jgi:2-keto-4-pentenoate hydratase/2-oxohepta-3-ene-1,7-dioic acid hydratase in catechol pathway
MKLVTFTYNGRSRIGEIIGDRVYTMAWADSMQQMIRRGILPSRTYEHFPLNEVTLEAPLRPGKIICIGLNYADHAKESGATPPEEPVIFAKLTSAVIATQQPISWRTSITKQVDYEGELAVVFGKRARDVKEEDALDYVLGYAVSNDVSARDLQRGKDTQWTRAKGLDTFCPLGPQIVTKDEIPDPNALSIQTKVNDEIMQDGNTSDMIHNVPKLIAFCSRMFTFEPGDVLMTGTPAGVGMGKKPARYLKDGDVVSITIENIGTLTNPCKVISEAE